MITRALLRNFDLSTGRALDGNRTSEKPLDSQLEPEPLFNHALLRTLRAYKTRLLGDIAQTNI
eukprot:1251590-Amorphochlora_amoeboformis.AAC.1